jgi:hypothetical protein
MNANEIKWPVNITYLRNVANHGKGADMTSCLHAACDEIESLRAQLANARNDVIDEAIKECEACMEYYATPEDLVRTLRNLKGAQ